MTNYMRTNFLIFGIFIDKI